MRHMTARKTEENMADYLGEDSAKKVQYFPEGSLLNTMIISIIDSEKRYTDILKEPYTVYLIETKWVRVTSEIFCHRAHLFTRFITRWKNLG